MLDDLPNRDEEIKLYYPPISLCTGMFPPSRCILPVIKLTSRIDNAAMIAWTAVLRLQAGAKGEQYNLPVRPKWSLEDLYDDLD